MSERRHKSNRPFMQAIVAWYLGDKSKRLVKLGSQSGVFRKAWKRTSSCFHLKMLSKISIVRLVPFIWVSDHEPGPSTMYKVITHIPYIGTIAGPLRHTLVMRSVVFMFPLNLRTIEGEDLVQVLELIRN